MSGHCNDCGGNPCICSEMRSAGIEIKRGIRKRTGKPNAASVLCIDRQGKTWKRHYWDCYTSTCARCAVDHRDWQKTAARRRAGELLVGERGEIVKLMNEEAI